MSGHRGIVRLVARREFVERVRDRGFLISTAITLVILIAFVGVSALMGGATRFALAVSGPGSADAGERVVAAATDLGIEVELRAVDGGDAAERLVRNDEVDAALVDGERIVVHTEAPTQLVGLIQAASAGVRAEAVLAREGVAPSEVRDALEQAPLPVVALEPLDRRQREYAAVGFVGVLALYGQLFAYGYWVAAGVVEEKSSRVIEVLLATVRPSQLLRGKILGIGVLGLVQLSLFGVVGFGIAQAAGALRFPQGALAVIGIVLLWFLLGYFFYAGLFAVAGAIVPRQEDLQATMTPLSIVIIASLFLGIEANRNPDSLLALVASLFPPSAPLVMPSRLVLGEAPVWQGVLSALLSIGATLALIPLATRIYARGALRGGRLRLRQALRESAD